MRKISAQRVIGTLVLLLFAALVLLPLFWLGVSAFKSEVAANLFPDRVGHNTVCLCVESAPDCQNAA